MKVYAVELSGSIEFPTETGGPPIAQTIEDKFAVPMLGGFDAIADHLMSSFPPEVEVKSLTLTVRGSGELVEPTSAA